MTNNAGDWERFAALSHGVSQRHPQPTRTAGPTSALRRQMVWQRQQTLSSPRHDPPLECACRCKNRELSGFSSGTRTRCSGVREEGLPCETVDRAIGGSRRRAIAR